VSDEQSQWTLAEVCELTGLEAHVLRYWESEFTQLRPRKGRNGTRQYRERDLQLVRRIQELLFTDQLTIQAARKKLLEEKSRSENPEQLGFLLGVEPQERTPLPLDFDRAAMIAGLKEVLDYLKFGRKSW
jgi:DNA-binding transcriptional MerR regulator